MMKTRAENGEEMKSHPGQLLVMAKDPQPGQVKTRLIPAIGENGACLLYEAMLKDVMGTMSLGPWQLTLAFTPKEAKPRFRHLAPDGVHLICQEGPTLGQRMIHAFDQLLGTGDPVVMRNSDSPDLPLTRVEEAFEALEQNNTDVVFGPDLGGGYYLVGMKKPHPEIFQLTMSTSNNLKNTRGRCEELGLRITVLQPHGDIDTPDDLSRLFADEAGTRDRCPRTWKAGKELGL